MTASPDAEDIAAFRDVVAERLGLRVDESRLGVLADILQRRAGGREDRAAYLDRLGAGYAASADLQSVARDLTVTETFFLRGADQLAAFANAVLPERLEAAARMRSVRILSAGCSSGEEPYSLAMMARDSVPAAAERIEIVAFDINPGALEKAARARYSSWALREVPDSVRARWFVREGDAFAIDASIRAAVAFHARNLAAEDAAFWQADRFDVVFCRNVLMYFTPQQAQAAVRRIARAMVPGGYLFLGHAETLRGLSEDFDLCHAHGTFYYRRKGDLRAASMSISLRVDAPLAGDASWFEIIERSTRRIHELAKPAPTPRAAASMPGDRDAADLGHVLAHLHDEKFDHAIEQLAALPAARQGDPDVQLLTAMSLCQRALFDDAQAVCRDVLARDASNAGAYYVVALCREGVGDLDGAAAQHRQAAYLDDAFAMPRLHLGLLARRRGDLDAAASELKRAISLLHDEDAARVALFGGGFGREALIALCRAECAARTDAS